jgi:serine/threonine-protein kinase
VHRDVKPSNIIVEAGGQIKITDFGIAHIEDPAATVQTQAGEILGTPAYMSPEQVLGQPVDGRSDLFSLGVILYELIAGQRPFGGEGKSLGNIFNDVVQVTPSEIPLTATAVPPGLSALIMKALQKDPAKRFQSGKEFAVALRGIVEDIVQVRRPPAVPVKKHRLLGVWLALAAMGLIIAASLVFYLFSRPPARPALPEKVDQRSPATVLPTPVPKPEAVEPPPEAKPSPPVPVQQPPKPVAVPEPRSAPKSRQPAPPEPQPKPKPEPAAASPSEPSLPGSLGGKLKAQEVKPVPGKMIEEKDY